MSAPGAAPRTLVRDQGLLRGHSSEHWRSRTLQPTFPQASPDEFERVAELADADGPVLRPRYPVTRLAVGLILLFGFLSAGCGGKVSVRLVAISGDGPYRAIWKRSWEQIHRDEVPYAATATSPGACNVGSTKRACVRTDRTVAADLRRLQEALRGVHVPGPYRRATALTLRAISHDLRGLNLRIRSLTVGNWKIAQRNEWFRQSKAELVTAQETFAKAWAAFPDWARPSPPPRV